MKMGKLRICMINLSVALFLILSGCKPLSEGIKGDDNKMNGGFEIVKNNLPVNWYFMSPEIIQSGDFSIILDTTEFKEGKQSLKFIIRKSPTDSRSPGFFKGFNAMGGETYKISFWLKNKGSSLTIETVSQEYLKNRLGKRDTTIFIDFDVPDWKYYEYYFKIPPEVKNIYFDVKIYKPGSVWFDDIQIVGTENDKGERTIHGS